MAATDVHTSAPSGTPFFGRQAELTLLERALDESACRGCAFILEGEPGIGKTSLAAELTRRARERGTAVLTSGCYQGEGAPPIWPWMQVVEATAGNRALLDP